MPDIVTTQKIRDGRRIAIFKFTNLSDGTGESLVKKIDVATLVPSCTRVAITKIHYSINGMVVTLFWEATSNVRILDLSNDGCLDFSYFSGIPNDAGTGVTGSILLSTTGHAVGRSYSLIIEVNKY